MTSKKDLLFQKGLQLQALNEQVTSSTTTSTTSKITSGKQARELAKVRELCPNGTDDDVLLQLLAQTKGDQAKMEQAVSELWENHRGGGNDEWATVEKKGKKKTESTYVSSRGGRDGAPRRDRPAYNKPQDSDGNPAGDDSETTDRSAGGRGGRGSVRGRGAPAARGGRGGGRGRGRGATPQSATTGEGDDNTDDNTETAEGDAANNNKVGSSGKGQRKDAPPTKSAETQPAVVTPTPVIPGLTGAWTKKPNLVGLVQQPKPAEPPKPAAQQPAPADKQPVAAKPPTPATASPASKPAPAPVASPAAKPSPAPVAAASPAAAVASPQKAPVASSPKKVASPKPIEMVASPKAAPESKPLEQPTISAWGSLDVSTTTIGDWTSTTTTVTEKKTVQTPNAWARGSPITNIATDAKSPATTAASAATVASPRDQSLSAGATATSPKYLKLGRWETGVSANLSLQFGSFSLNGVEQHTEASSPRGWASATTTTTTTTAKTTTKAEAPNAWGTQPAQSPKKKALSPAPRKNESEDRKTTSAPPGLSVESGRLTPKSAQSPRTFAPSAPSPASLPKPDDVKRTTPTHSQGGPFQGGSQASAKIGSGSTYASDFGGKSSSIYQATYGQYAMGLGASTNQSNTPKSGNARNNATTAGAVPSPTHGAQSAPAQYQPQSQQPQPQQKPAQQQAQQAQGAQPHPHQGHGHAHQNIPPHHQAGPPGYHPHYAPPPPPGIPMGYNPYNYAGYYQGYPYYQNPQYAQYSPRAQYPPRGSVPYGVEGPIPGFASGPNVPYQDQHLHDYPGAIPQGFGEISGAYLNQPGHHHHGHQQSGPQSHGKNQNQGSASAQQPRSGGSGFQGYQSSGNSRDHGATSGVANPSTNVNAASAAASYSQQQQHYGWASYGAQPMGGWGHMVPQGYQQQNPSQHAHQQSYRQYSSNNAQGGNASSEGSGVGSSHGTHSHAWSS